MEITTFDINAASETGADVVLKHPVKGIDLIDDNGKPVTIHIKGTESESYRAKERELVRIRLERVNRSRDAGPEAMMENAANFDIQDDEAAELLAACTTGWSDNLDYRDKKSFPFTPANAKALYLDQRWIADQLRTAQKQRANFLKG